MSDRFVVPNRSSSARLTSASSSINSWTISSLEMVAAPWRANARRASLFPAPMPPVIATLSGLLGLVGLGLGSRLGLGLDVCRRFGCRIRRGLDGGRLLGRLLRLRLRLGLGLRLGFRENRRLGGRLVELVGCLRRRRRSRARTFGEDLLGQPEIRRQLRAVVIAELVA